ncbi:MAG: PIN domain-containing protein [Thermoguttaceae bacterium]
MVSIGLGVVFINSGVIPADAEWSEWMFWGTFVGMLLLPAGIVMLDVCIRQKQLDTISSVYFGMIVGLFMAYVASLAMTPLFYTDDPSLAVKENLRAIQFDVQLVLGLVFCYVCVSLLMQTKHDFRFIIPYVEFAREFKGIKSLILDTSVVIDGRIADVIETQLFDGPLIMPKFVIGELQGIADSSDRLRRSRGRRGLDILNRLRNNPDIDLEIFERDLPEFADQPVDLKLVILAKHLEGKLVTNDYNLNKVARLQGIDVINLNDVANALKPIFLPGEQIEVHVVKAGEEAGQGVGYLEDGTMVVIEGGRDHVNQLVVISVTSVLQTSAGRMVFGRCEGKAASKS